MKVAIFFLMIVSAMGEEWVNLWPGEAPGAARPAKGSEKISDGWRFGHIEVPQYRLYKPEKPAQSGGQCVVVLPGGGYTILAMNHEGREVGEWLAKQGITAVVVKYRVSGNADFGYGYPVPQMDARRAIRTVRAKAKEWGVDPKKVGVMGFSAGGHLASCCATQFKDVLEQETKDEIDKEDCRPDFAILCYPVIAMGTKHGHSGSQNRLLGKNPSAELLAKNNTALRVTKETPPVFIVHSTDDGGVPLRNSTDFMAACAEKKVPVRACIFEKGGHGYGLSGKGDSKDWHVHLAAWLKTR